MKTCTRSDTIKNIKFEIWQLSKKIDIAEDILWTRKLELVEYEADLEYELNN